MRVERLRALSHAREGLRAGRSFLSRSRCDPLLKRAENVAPRLALRKERARFECRCLCANEVTHCRSVAADGLDEHFAICSTTDRRCERGPGEAITVHAR